ncbi:GNAT family N-acetyltransferase [Mangrovibacterium lignilyticum]|uniref:GNAT family N-acetyltransferase n=1 Tax=Mangrovibacterium lignilyticum TaxID=2668052 RepID=UPI0013CF7915|nr:GNAT family N-acetyltransferase [Mangrovibacterium lignilyticum]
MNLIIERVHAADAQLLTELTFRSKAYWKYSPEQMEAWREELKITSDYLEYSSAYKLLVDDQLVGYYTYRPIDAATAKLDNLFIEPEFIGRGYGNYLLSDFMMQVQEAGFERVVLDADPNSEAFYLSYGFRTVGHLKTDIEGRFMPVMERLVQEESES